MCGVHCVAVGSLFYAHLFAKSFTMALLLLHDFLVLVVSSTSFGDCRSWHAYFKIMFSCYFKHNKIRMLVCLSKLTLLR